MTNTWTHYDDSGTSLDIKVKDALVELFVYDNCCNNCAIPLTPAEAREVAHKLRVFANKVEETHD